MKINVIGRGNEGGGSRADGAIRATRCRSSDGTGATRRPDGEVIQPLAVNRAGLGPFFVRYARPSEL